MSELPAEALRLLLDTGAKMITPVVLDNGDRMFPTTGPGGVLKWDRIKEAVPDHVAQTVRVTDDASFVEYVKRFAQEGQSLLFGDDEFGINAVLDYHAPSLVSEAGGVRGAVPEKGYCEHLVVYPFRHSVQFCEWSRISGKLLSQDTFAEFLEQNGRDVITPSAAILAELVADLEVTQIKSVSNKTNLSNGCVQLKCTSEDSTKSGGQVIVVPKKIVLQIPIYAGDAPVELPMFLRYRVKDGSISFEVRFDRVSDTLLDVARSKISAIAQAVGIPVIYGGYNT